MMSIILFVWGWKSENSLFSYISLVLPLPLSPWYFIPAVEGKWDLNITHLPLLSVVTMDCRLVMWATLYRYFTVTTMSFQWGSCAPWPRWNHMVYDQSLVVLKSRLKTKSEQALWLILSGVKWLQIPQHFYLLMIIWTLLLGHLVYYHIKQFPPEFMVSIASLKSSFIQHNVYFVNYDPI